MDQDGEHDVLHSGSLPLPLDTRSPHRARVFTADHMARAGCSSEEIATATLVVSELVTNAVQHARSDATLHVSVFDDHTVVGVEDGSPVLPMWREHGHLDTEGRGMAIMSAFGQVAVVELPAGKVVEVTLPRA